jgi:hypothetical protein
MRMTLESRFTHACSFELPGFTYAPPPYGGLEFRAFDDTPAAHGFENFADRVIRALGRSYLPIYRMADGEFAFLVGERRLRSADGVASVGGVMRRAAAGLARQLRRGRTRTCWGEQYSRRERDEAIDRFAGCLRRVASSGIVAAYFAHRPDGWGESYFSPVCRWFDARGIALDERNYVPFYSVYALLNGPFRAELFGGRSILVVTHLTEARRAAIEAGLKAEGAAEVRFAGISANRALFDTLDVERLDPAVDLALVAGGIGSVNLVDQLAPLSIPCIDCGIGLECLVEPERRWERPFLIDDARVAPAELAERRRTSRFGSW